MTSDDSIERLIALEHFGIKLGLANIERLTAALGHPHRRFASIHVAGTNGKGSVTAMVERALRHAGYRTGRYTSPHLARIEERVAINGLPISEHTFRELAAEILATVDHLRRARALETTPTFFEVTTAIAFEAFRRAQVDVAVIEVGLGGRFDATNIITPRVAAITSIAFDHQKYLGDSLASIAFEKAGILKTGVPAVIGEVEAEVRDVIEQVAKQRQAPLSYADGSLVAEVSMHKGRATITVDTAGARYDRVTLSLNGGHQIANAIVAIRLLEVFAQQGFRVTPDDIVAGLTQVDWPARLEWLRLSEHRHLLLDAAHNAAGAEALARYLTGGGFAPLPIVLAVMQDKDVAAIVATLTPAASRFIVTTVPTPRALSAGKLATLVRAVTGRVAVDQVEDAEAAITAALHAAPRAAAAGSIFFIGPLRERLLSAGALSCQGS